MGQIGGQRRDTADSAEEETQLVKVMNRLIDQHAASLAGDGAAPGVLLIIFIGPQAVENKIHADNAPELPLFDQPPERAVRRLEAVLKNAGNHQFRMAFRRIGHPLEILRHAAGRLFADYMFPRFERIDNDLRMAGMVGADADQLDLRIGEQVTIVDGTAGDAVLFAEFLHPFRNEVADVHDFDIGQRTVALHVGRGNDAAADDPAFDHDETNPM